MKGPARKCWFCHGFQFLLNPGDAVTLGRTQRESGELRKLTVWLIVATSALTTSCGGGRGDENTGTALFDGTRALLRGITQTPISPQARQPFASTAQWQVNATNLMDWAESAFPNYFPSHQQDHYFAPYEYRFYPETGNYIGIDGQDVRIYGPSFGPAILTVGTLPQFTCHVFPIACTPAANAGAPQDVFTGSTVTLHGSGVDPAGAALGFSWTFASKPAGSSATLSSPTLAEPTFIADRPGTYELTLIVSNGTFTSSSSTVQVHAQDYVAPFSCTESTSDPLSNAPRSCHDLDGDGVADTRVTFSAGKLQFTGAVQREIFVDGSNGANVSAITAIGQHAGGPLSELAVRIDDYNSGGNRAVVYVFDLEAVSPEIARSTQPFRTPSGVWVGYPSVPDGRRFPVMAPGQEQSNVTWTYLCKFTPGAPDTGCGTGFSKMEAYPENVSSFRRHQGAWVQDVNGDGTQDIQMSFYSVVTTNPVYRMDGGVLTISMADGARTWTPLNMAESASDFEALYGGATQPSWSSLAPLAQGFDSGRLYGAASAFSAGGQDKTLMVGGQTVSYFPQSNTDHNDAWLVMCNVARYVGLLSNPAGQVGSRHLQWGWYFGFQQAVFQNNSGDGALLKSAFMAHGCIHRYSDSRVTSAQGASAVAFNVFRLNSPAPSCETEQRALFSGGFTDYLQQMYRTCVIGTASQPGRWTLQVLDEADGSGVVAIADSYMWGYTTKLLPGGALSFIVEPFDAPTPFARPKDSPRKMKIFALQSSPAWQLQHAGTFPVTGRPALRYDSYETNPPVEGQGKNGNFMHLRTRPNQQATGLVDVQLENGQWVGYSPSAAAIVLK